MTHKHSANMPLVVRTLEVAIARSLSYTICRPRGRRVQFRRLGETGSYVSETSPMERRRRHAIHLRTA
jgi:hypothetical protein